MMPAAEAVVPESPFQAVASDYRDFGVSHYLIAVECFSNWPTVSYVKPGAPSSDSKGLLAAYAFCLEHLGCQRKFLVMVGLSTFQTCLKISQRNGALVTENPQLTIPNQMAELKCVSRV